MTPKPADDEFVAWFKKTSAELVAPTQAFIDIEGEYHPSLIVYSMNAKDVAVIPVGMFFTNITGKDFVSLLHKTIADDEMVATVILITEAWTLQGDPHISMTDDIRNHPRREEALVMNAIRKGMQLIAAYPLKDKKIGDKPRYIYDTQAGPIDDKKGRAHVGYSIGRMVVGDEERTHKPKH